MPGSPTWPKWLMPTLLAALTVGLTAWLLLTPAGLLGKADALGYAVCHRFADRSFAIAGRPLPLCARCSGLYLGILVGWAYQARLGRRAGLPGRWVQALFGFFLALFAIDGTNSYLTLFPLAPSLYPPQNGLRLATGTLLGVGVSALLLPVFHQVAWREWDPRPAFGSIRQLPVPLGLAGVAGLAIASQNPLLAYPLAVVSVASLAGMLVLTYGILWIMVLKRENQSTTWKDLAPVLALGALTALAQVALVDAVRFWLTGTWNGIF